MAQVLVILVAAIVIKQLPYWYGTNGRPRVLLMVDPRVLLMGDPRVLLMVDSRVLLMVDPRVLLMVDHRA
jgi:hypothetical protein